MGLTKQYLAYHPIGNFNIIASANANISFVTYDKTDGRFVAVGAAENVYIWDLRWVHGIWAFLNNVMIYWQFSAHQTRHKGVGIDARQRGGDLVASITG